MNKSFGEISKDERHGINHHLRTLDSQINTLSLYLADALDSLSGLSRYDTFSRAASEAKDAKLVLLRMNSLRSVSRILHESKNPMDAIFILNQAHSDDSILSEDIVKAIDVISKTS